MDKAAFTPIIDTHTHPVSRDTDSYPLRQQTENTRPDSQARRPGEGGMVEKGLDTETMLAAMAVAGVHKTVLVQSSNLYGFDNSYIADSVAAFPANCIGLCAIDVLAPDAADVLSYWVKQRGMQGVRLTMPDELDNPATFPVWERARDLGIPVDVQMRPVHLETLDRVLRRFPDVPVVIDHAGNVNRRLPDGTPAPVPPPAELLALARRDNLYLKLTCQNLDGVRETGAPPEAFFGPIVREFGASRLLWGTDFPATADQDYSERLEQSLAAFSFMSETERAWVMGRTALRLWPRFAA